MGIILKKINIIMLVLSFVVCGCGIQKTESSTQAIEISKDLKTAEQKVIYLIKQAQAFYSSKEFQATIDIAQHILLYLDKDSRKAKDLFAKAKYALISEADKAFKSAKDKFGNI